MKFIDSPDGPAAPRRILFILLALAALCAAAYWNTLFNDYVYDDKDYILAVPAFQETLVIKDLFTPRYFEVYRERTYRPVGTLSFFADSLLWKMKPWGAHAFNIFLHALACWMVFASLHALTGRLAASGFGAAVFAAHPVHVEAVALASNREELLCALFFFAAMYLYLLWRRVRRDTPAFLVLVCLSFTLALYSKEMAATLPGALVLCDLVVPPAGMTRTRALRRGLPFYLATGAILVATLAMRSAVMHHQAGGAEYPGGGPFHALLTMSVVFFRYARLLVAPWPLCADYAVTAARGLSWLNAAALAGVCAFAAAAFVLARRAPLAGFALLFFALSWLPVSNVIPFGEVMAERYMYLPSFAVSVLVAFALCIASGKRSSVLRLACGAAVAAMLAGCMARSAVWRDDATLWRNTVQCQPCSAKAHHNMGNVLARQGDFTNALEHYNAATRCGDEAEQFKLEYNRALTLLALGRNAEAERGFLESLRLHPGFVLPYYNLGKLAAQRGDRARAAQYFLDALAAEPDNAQSYCVAGHQLWQFAQTPDQKRDALKILNRCVDMDPGNAGARAELAIALLDLGHRRSALHELRTALSMEPANPAILKIFESLGVPAEPAVSVDALASAPSPWKAWLFLALIFFGIIICVMFVYYLAME